jgi:hypothetical protein
MFAAFPLVSLFAQNQTDLELSALFWPLVLCIVGMAAVYGVLLAITRRPAKALVLASLMVIAVFYFELFTDNGSAWYFLLWLAVAVVGVVAVLRTSRELGPVVLVLGVVAAVLVVPKAVTVVSYQADHPGISADDRRLWATALPEPAPARGAPLPDIYVIIPDDYARTDVLRKYFHFDNSAFDRALERRGFVLSQQNRSPYSDSESNIAAMLNMDYLTNFPRVLGKDSQDVRLVQRVSEDSRAARLLTSAGYEYVHLDTDEVTFAGGNPGISPLAPPDSFVNLWLRKSILHRVGGPIGFNQAATDARFRTSIDSEFEKLGALPASSKPKFVVFHTLLPHDPYLLDARGKPVTYPVHADLDLSSAAGRAHYVQQLRYTSRELLRSIDRIRAHAKTPPVIVLAADEGFQAEPEVFGEAAGEDIRVKGIAALSLPGLEQPAVPTPPNTVNLLRFVLNHYLGTHYPMLESASYADGDLPYEFPKISVR